VEDAAQAVAQIALRGHAGFFDIGSGTLCAPTQLLETIEDLTGHTLLIDTIAPNSLSQVSPLPAADLTGLEACGIRVAFRELATGLKPL
jgi:hypothetical protein